MEHREFTVTLPHEVAARLAAGEDVSDHVGEAIRHQVRREAITEYLGDCGAAGLAPLADSDRDEFLRTVGGQLRTYTWIYDTPALVAHTVGRSRRVRVGLQLIADEPGLSLRVPMLCLLEAYAQLSGDEARRLLDGLATSPGVTVVPLAPDRPTAMTVGDLATGTGRAGAAHAAHVAIENRGPSIVFTDAPMPVEVLSRPA